MRTHAWTVTLLLAALIARPPDATARTVRIGAVVDGPWAHNAEILELCRKEIQALTANEPEVELPDELIIIGDWTTATIDAGLDRLLADASCDMVLAMGVGASQVAAHKTGLSKPVLAPFIVNPDAQGVPPRDGASGIENLSYLTSPFNPDRDIEVFRDIQSFDTLTVLIGQPLTEAIPNFTELLDARIADAVPSIRYLTVGNSAADALARIPAGTQAIYVTSLLYLSETEFTALVDGINERGLPSFSMMGRMDVERGVLYGLAPGSTFNRFARRIALHVHRILRGEDPATLPVSFSGGERLTINMRTARMIRLYPSWRVISEADVINAERTDVSRTWDLKTVLTEALKGNLELEAVSREVEAGGREVAKAWSNWLPQADVGAELSQIDSDRPTVTLGVEPERLLAGRAGASQLIFDEGAMANVTIQKRLQRARELDRDRVELDIHLSAATAFLDVLRAKTVERIERDNLLLTRENLERARTRRGVGVAGPGEVYRWEVEMANARTAVINANARRNLAEMEFNRIINRPLEEPFATVELGVDDPQLMSVRDIFTEGVGDPASFRIFRSFMVQEALQGSPEIAALDAQISAQERLFASTGWSFIAPTLSLQGDITQRWWKDGAGSDPPPLDPGFPPSDDTFWSVGIVATLDLFRGGGKIAARNQAGDELAALRVRRNDLANAIEQRTRASLHTLGASFAAIEYSREASRAARQNLEIVQDSYTRGTVSIIDLLDAQNASLIADNQAANAGYDFLIDVVRVGRAIGKYYFLASQEERDAFRARALEYMETNR